LIPFLMFCYVVAYLDRINVGFAKLEMLRDLNFTETQYGLGAGMFFAGYIIFAIPSSLLVHRLGPKVWIACIMTCWAVISGLFSMVKTPSEFYALRFLLGVAEAGFYPGMILYITRWFPDEYRGRALSMFQSAVALAGIVGGPLSGSILDHMGGHWHLAGWQWLFVLEAVPALFAGVTVFFYLDNGVAQARWLTAAQKEWLSAQLALESGLKAPSSARAVFSDIRVWGLGVVVFGIAAGTYGIFFWMPTLLHETGGLSNSQVGWISAIPNLVALVAMYLTARSSDLKRERRWHVVLATLAGGLGLVLSVMWSANLPMVLLGLCLASAGVMSAMPLQWNFVMAFSGGASAAAALGLINSVGNLGGVVSPALIGWLKDRTLGLSAGMYAIAACVIVSALVALCYPARLVNRR
jgi:MFS family permease